MDQPIKKNIPNVLLYIAYLFCLIISLSFAKVAGISVVQHTGYNLIIPVGFSLFVWFLLKKFKKDLSPLLIAALSVQAGHLFWFLALDAYILAGEIFWGNFHMVSPYFFALTLPDILILGTGILWAFLKPGIGSLVCLCAYQSFSLINNLRILNAGGGSDKSLLAHILLRIVAIALMGIIIFSHTRKSRNI